MARTQQIERQRKDQKMQKRLENAKKDGKSLERKGIKRPTYYRKKAFCREVQKQQQQHFASAKFFRLIKELTKELQDEGLIYNTSMWRATKGAKLMVQGLMHNKMIKDFRLVGLVSAMNNKMTLTDKTFKDTQDLLDLFQSGLEIRT